MIHVALVSTRLPFLKGDDDGNDDDGDAGGCRGGCDPCGPRLANSCPLGMAMTTNVVVMMVVVEVVVILAALVSGRRSRGSTSSLQGIAHLEPHKKSKGDSFATPCLTMY